MDKRDKTVFLFISGVLSGIALLFFCMAVFSTPPSPVTPEKQVHIFINQDDSTVTQLRNDVNNLSSILNEVRSDTLVFEMRKTNHKNLP